MSAKQEGLIIDIQRIPTLGGLPYSCDVQGPQLSWPSFARKCEPPRLHTVPAILRGVCVLSHLFHHDFGIRIKKTEAWRDDTFKGYTGYINIDHRHIYFQFFESYDDPDRDNFIFWLSGPLGYSSSAGALMELANIPNRFLYSHVEQQHDTKPTLINRSREYVFIDQPVGFWFSAATYEGDTSSTIFSFAFSTSIPTHWHASLTYLLPPHSHPYWPWKTYPSILVVYHTLRIPTYTLNGND
ncbi:hypothetical protein BDQ17DRAFT_1332544 [Cyathus striatus]|nr:hypothetical protein BDQ17DRAFT_1332544 [Cyathus striatus]